MNSGFQDNRVLVNGKSMNEKKMPKKVQPRYTRRKKCHKRGQYCGTRGHLDIVCGQLTALYFKEQLEKVETHA